MSLSNSPRFISSSTIPPFRQYRNTVLALLYLLNIA
nr:MAG TPA: hypothetical protein [Caudoviricetes sp.]